MQYILECGTGKYLGTSTDGRLAVISSPFTALRFTTPEDGYQFIAKKCNKQLKSRKWFALQIDPDGMQGMSFSESDAQQSEENDIVVPPELQLNSEDASFTPDFVNGLFSLGFDTQAVVSALDVISAEFVKLDDVHEQLEKALSLYDKALSDIAHTVEFSCGEDRETLLDDIILVEQMRKLRKRRRVIKNLLSSYNCLAPVVPWSVRKRALQDNLMLCSEQSQNVYNVRVANRGILMGCDSFVSKKLLLQKICGLLSDAPESEEGGECHSG